MEIIVSEAFLIRFLILLLFLTVFFVLIYFYIKKIKKFHSELIEMRNRAIEAKTLSELRIVLNEMKQFKENKFIDWKSLITMHEIITIIQIKAGYLNE